MSARQIALATAALAILTGSAQAADKNQGPVALGVYDSKGVFVGTLISTDVLARQYGNTWYSVSFQVNGIAGNESILYTSSNCTGNKYGYVYSETNIPIPLFYDGVDLYAATGSNLTINAQSYEYGGTCYSYSFTAGVNLLTVIDSTHHGWTPPFSIVGK